MTKATDEKPLSKLPIFLATFKGYYSIDQTVEMIEQLLEKVKTIPSSLHVAAPLDFIAPLAKHFTGQSVVLGADLMLSADPTAFTGSIAGLSLQKIGCMFTLIGTAQERALHSPTGQNLKNKIERALEKRIHPIFAIGESLHEFEDGASEKVLSQQLSDALEGLSKEQLDQIAILYDIPWLSDSSWGDTSEYIHKAYAHFVKATQEYLKSKEAATKLLFSIPCFAEHLPKMPSEANCEGYYAGVITPGHTIEPLHLHPEVSRQEIPKAKEAAPESPPLALESEKKT